MLPVSLIRTTQSLTETVVIDWLRDHPWNAGRLIDTLECHSIPGDWVGGDANEWRKALVDLHAAIEAAQKIEERS